MAFPSCGLLTTPRPYRGVKRALSVLVLSEEVFVELLARERRIALDIERDGIPV